jgi:hypothetical protein
VRHQLRVAQIDDAKNHNHDNRGASLRRAGFHSKQTTHQLQQWREQLIFFTIDTINKLSQVESCVQ